MTGEWRKQAACARPDVNPDLWFAIPPGRVAADPLTNEALRICRRCPVRDQCLDEALEQGEEHGVWGGLMPLERQLYDEELPCTGCGREFRRRHRLQRKCGYCRAKQGNARAQRADRPECGTRGGYQRHLYRSETPCVWCEAANTEYHRALRAAKKAS